MVALGADYRLSDIHSALGLSQLGRLEAGLRRREIIAARYGAAFAAMPGVLPAPTRPETRHAWHLYPLRFDTDRLLTLPLFPKMTDTDVAAVGKVIRWAGR